MGYTWVIHGLYMGYTWVDYTWVIIHGLYMGYTWVIHGLYMGYTWVIYIYIWVIHGLYSVYTQNHPSIRPLGVVCPFGVCKLAIDRRVPDAGDTFPFLIGGGVKVPPEAVAD